MAVFVPRFLRQLRDVLLTSPQDGDVLAYSDSSGKWENSAGGGGGGAPTNATYITQTSNGSLSNEQALADLSTGLLKVTATTGVLSTASAGTDYAAASHAHAGEDITSGTVADARIASTIARDSEVTSAISALSSVYQAKDTTLDTYAGIDPSANVQSVLAAANYAAVRTLLDLEAGTDFPSQSTFDDHSARHEDGGADEISIAGLSGTPAALQAHLDDTADAHAATAITNTAAGNIASTTVQAAINELDSEKTTAAAALSAAQTEIADQKRVVAILVSDPGGSAITTGDGKAVFRVPTLLNGHNLVSVGASVSTVSSSGIPTVQLRRMRRTNATTQSAADMLSTKLTIDESEFDSADAAAAAVIDTSNDDVQTGDQINVDIDVAGTGAKGLVVTMTFEAP